MKPVSRREFACQLAASLAVVRARRSVAQTAPGPIRLGLNTYSLRALSADEAVPIILDVMHATGLEDCQLWARHIEPAQFSSPYPGPGDTPAQVEERRAKATALSQWRLTVPLSYFETVRDRFKQRGVRIRSYSVALGTTPAEIERQFDMARALGAEVVLLRVPEQQTDMVAAVAQRQRMIVGLQFSDPAVLQRQRKACPWFRADPDIGDLTRGGVDALAFVREHYRTFVSIDLKDAVSGGASVPFGKGDARMHEVLRFLQTQRAGMTAYVDCDYPGTGRSVDEVKACTAFARRCLASREPMRFTS